MSIRLAFSLLSIYEQLIKIYLPFIDLLMQTNHVCEYYEDTSVCSTATQIAVQGAVIDPVTLRPWEGERFLLVGLKRSAAQVQKNKN